MALSWSTGDTSSIKKEFVPGGAEATREAGFELSHTTLKLIELATIITPKMVMMSLASNFETRSLARKINCYQPAILDECLDVAIHRGNSQAAMMVLGNR